MRSRDLDDVTVDGSTIAAWKRHLGGKKPDVKALRARLSSGTLAELTAQASRFGSRPAIHVEGTSVSHAELAARTASVANHLSSIGVSQGDRVLLIAAVGLEEIVAYLAILRIGATAVLANPSLTPSEISAMRATSGAEWLIASGAGLDSEVTTGPWREVVGIRPDDRSASTVVLDPNLDKSLPIFAVDPDSTAILAFTSGTTGSPKATPLTHRNLLSSIKSIMIAWEWDREDHLVHSLPISHQHGLGGIHATLLAGSRLSLLGSFDPETTLHAIDNRAASVHFGVPAIYQRLLARLGERVSALGTLRLAVSGSGPLPVGLAGQYEEVVGQALLERYGTTESGLNVSNPYAGPRQAGMVGLPLPGIEVALATDNGVVLTKGEVGEILIRGPQVFPGYEGMQYGEQPFMGRWFRTGDLGQFDPETGYLRIVGRLKELIITGGMNVYPQELVDILLRQPGVADAAVVGVPSEEWGEEVVAVVSPADLDTAAIARGMSEALAPYKRPKRIVSLPEIPRNHVGKLVLGELTRQIPPIG